MEDKNQPVTKEYLDKTMSEYSKTIIEAVNFGFEKNRKEHQRLEQKIDESWTRIDGYVKAQESFKQEFEIMKSKISKIEGIIKDKLGVEI